MVATSPTYREFREFREFRESSLISLISLISLVHSVQNDSVLLPNPYKFIGVVATLAGYVKDMLYG